jgi:hypothetical protein
MQFLLPADHPLILDEFATLKTRIEKNAFELAKKAERLHQKPRIDRKPD